jgi:prepilin-type processing-associated H-X9-DG protein
MYQTRRNRNIKPPPAFTRIELLACLGACTLLMGIILPSLANSTSRSDLVLCVNNLRQIGVAYAQFGLEARDGLPAWRVPMSEGGNSNHPLKNNSFVQFSALSNYLAHPGLLADPGDSRRNLNPARHWGTSPGGLWHPAHQNNAISYILGLHGDLRMPRTLLSGDRNLFASQFVSSCSSGISPVARLEGTTVRWTNAVHGVTGNLLFFDGSVEQTESNRLRETIFFGLDSDVGGGDTSRTHILSVF